MNHQQSEINALRDLVRRQQAELCQRDETNAALRARIVELQRQIDGRCWLQQAAAQAVRNGE